VGSTPAPVLELRGIGRVWRAGAGDCVASVRALRGVDLRAFAGEVVALTGPRGAGKTTLLLCAAGLAHADEGHLRGVAVGHTAYISAADEWAAQALAAADAGVRAVLLDVLDPPGLASPRAVAAIAGTLAAEGLAVIVASRDRGALPAFAARLVTLAAGRIVDAAHPLETVRQGRCQMGASHAVSVVERRE
jgi:ABC-type sulfate/molybdate transport systems ATPase subunit